MSFLSQELSVVSRQTRQHQLHALRSADYSPPAFCHAPETLRTNYSLSSRRSVVQFVTLGCDLCSSSFPLKNKLVKMAAFLTASTSRAVARHASTSTVHVTSSARPTALVRPSSVRGSLITRSGADQQTDSRDSYQVRPAVYCLAKEITCFMCI